VPGKRRVLAFLKNVQQGLLDQSVDDARHAEVSDPTVRLGDFDPFDRLRLIGSFEQLRPNAWPMLTQSYRAALPKPLRLPRERCTLLAAAQSAQTFPADRLKIP
jgi:hypothetical protein